MGLPLVTVYSHPRLFFTLLLLSLRWNSIIISCFHQYFVVFKAFYGYICKGTMVAAQTLDSGPMKQPYRTWIQSLCQTNHHGRSLSLWKYLIPMCCYSTVCLILLGWWESGRTVWSAGQLSKSKSKSTQPRSDMWCLTLYRVSDLTRPTRPHYPSKTHMDGSQISTRPGKFAKLTSTLRFC